MFRSLFAFLLLAACAHAQSAPPANKPNRIRLSQGASAQLVVKQVLPEYPAEALKAGEQGTVEVAVEIDTQGKIAKAEAVSGPSSLRSATVEAAKQFEFKPFVINVGGTSQALIVETKLGFNFTLRGSGETRTGEVHFLNDLR